MTEKSSMCIDPRKADCPHLQILNKCGTYGHHRIINEMIIEETKKLHKIKDV